MQEQLTALSRELVRTLHQDCPSLRADQVVRGSAELAGMSVRLPRVDGGYGDPDGLQTPGRGELVSGGRGAELA